MKKLFTVFCAVCLMPTFSAQAWVGGPFSNNSFFGDTADDGIYEAAATAVNGIGLFRIVVGNNFDGVNPSSVTTSLPVVVPLGTNGTFTLTPPPIGSGNVVIGGLASRFSNMWFVNGVFYAGFTFGSASSVTGTVQAMAEARNLIGLGTTRVSSSFLAQFQGSGKFLPARAFSGFGQASVVTDAGVVVVPTFNFSVFGSKVSSRITFGL